MRYRDAGVDIARADAARAAMGRAVQGTWDGRVRRIPGGFAGTMAFPGSADVLLAATMDGVGTKLHVALAERRVADAAADLVYHGANDLLAHGARPVAFLDYVAQGRLDPEVLRDAVEGMARACREVGAVLLGGETAEMPDTYVEGVVDIAGCMIGAVDAGAVVDGAEVKPGDHVLGLASAGLHTNGFSLARRVVERSGLALGAPLPGGNGETLGDALLAPHRWYGRSVLPLLGAGRIRAIAHVTGGGIAGNLVRVLPPDAEAVVHADAWPRPAVFRWLCERGGVPEDDARAAFNLGVGLVLVTRPGDAAEVAEALGAAGEQVFTIGEVAAGRRGVRWSDEDPRSRGGAT